MSTSIKNVAGKRGVGGWVVQFGGRIDFALNMVNIVQHREHFSESGTSVVLVPASRSSSQSNL